MTTPQQWYISTAGEDALFQFSFSNSQAVSMDLFVFALFVVTGDPSPRHSEQGHRPFVKGEHTLWRVAPPPSDSGSAMEEVWSGGHRSLHLVQNSPLSVVFFSLWDKDVDTLTHPCPSMLLYAFPLLCLITPTLVRVKEQSLTLILIAARWPKSQWLAEIIPLLYTLLWLLSLSKDLLSQVNVEIFTQTGWPSGPDP